MSLESLLAGWLPRQRWYSAKSAGVDAVRLRGLARPVETDERLVDLLLAEVEAAGRTTTYLVPLTRRRERVPGLDGARLGEDDGWQVYDALRDGQSSADLLALLGSDPVGDLRPGGQRLSPVTGAPLGAEQSNTSLVHGDVIVKWFRRLSPSPNPDLEVTRRLGELGSPHVAPALSWLEGAGWTLAIAQPFLRGAGEGWALALTSVRDLLDARDVPADQAGGDFAPEAQRLGAVTAGLHADLRAAFGTAEVAPAAEAALMRRRLDDAVASVAALAPLAERVAACYDAVADLPGAIAAQRVHGDYHLGQVLRTPEHWVVLDFEGEPARPVEERTPPMSPWRDVAGMLRSFDYAAWFLRGDYTGALAAMRSREWGERNREAFLRGYADEAGRDPRDDAVLLRAYELDKAVYEVRYEADHRPDWVDLPLRAVDALAAGAMA